MRWSGYESPLWPVRIAEIRSSALRGVRRRVTLGILATGDTLVNEEPDIECSQSDFSLRPRSSRGTFGQSIDKPTRPKVSKNNRCQPKPPSTAHSAVGGCSGEGDTGAPSSSR